jgi:DNA recombination protein RmuC
MIKKILLIIFFIQPVYSLELILKSGDAFICDTVEENDRFIKVRFKDKLYEIPKSEIQMRDISQKYIVVAEGTVDYALMYIPSEAIYYEIINTASLCDFAADKRVLAVSPMSFYAYMKSILMSFEGQKIQSQAKEILLTLKSIKKDYEKTDEAMAVLQKHIGNSYNQLSNVTKLFSGLGQKLDSTHLLSSKENKVLESNLDDVVVNQQDKLID